MIRWPHLGTVRSRITLRAERSPHPAWLPGVSKCEMGAEPKGMITVTQDILIPSPPSEVFAFLCDPLRATYLWPAAVQTDQGIERPGGLYQVQGHATRPNGSMIHFEQELLRTRPRDASGRMAADDTFHAGPMRDGDHPHSCARARRHVTHH